jgi:hypothetical protein
MTLAATTNIAFKVTIPRTSSSTSSLDLIVESELLNILARAGCRKVTEIIFKVVLCGCRPDTASGAALAFSSTHAVLLFLFLVLVLSLLGLAL